MNGKRKAPGISHGKAFEKLLHDACKDLYLTYPILWERVIDSHDAGNLVRAADADFKLTFKSGTDECPCHFHIECKASVKYQSLSDKGAVKALMKPQQIAKLRMARRAGVGCRVLFHDVKGKRVELYTGDVVIAHFLHKRGEPLPSTPLEPLDSFCESGVKEWVIGFITGYGAGYEASSNY